MYANKEMDESTMTQSHNRVLCNHGSSTKGLCITIWSELQDILNEKKQIVEQCVWYATFCERKAGGSRKKE